jgi:hypothetical protein
MPQGQLYILYNVIRGKMINPAYVLSFLLCFNPYPTRFLKTIITKEQEIITVDGKEMIVAKDRDKGLLRRSVTMGVLSAGLSRPSFLILTPSKVIARAIRDGVKGLASNFSIDEEAMDLIDLESETDQLERSNLQDQSLLEANHTTGTDQGEDDILFEPSTPVTRENSNNFPVNESPTIP